MSTQQTGAEMIATERQRQIDVEGWTQQHDANHSGPWLAFAAITYATPEDERDYATYDTLTGSFRLPHSWPWGPDSWKPTPDDRVRELVKAGALIAAEIDRLTAEVSR